jgi:uncharacterized protein (DUF169 family)
MDPASLAAHLERYTRVATFPLGVALLAPGEQAPPRAKQPERDFGHRIAVCQGYTIARRFGWMIAARRGDINCPLTKIAHGFDAPTADYLRGDLCCGMYTATAEAGARSEAAVPKFAPGTWEAVLAGPLSRWERDPAVVLMYGNSAQVMLLLAAALHERGGALTCSFAPRIDCSESVIRTIQTGEPQVILPCYGDRAIGGTEDHEMAFAFPWARAGEVARGLEGLHKGGVRYPIPSNLLHEPSFPPKYEELDARLRAAPDPAAGRPSKS